MLLDINKFADGIKALAEENKILKEENKMLKESSDAVSREEYEELYHKAEEVNRMANEILADFPSYKELVSVVRCKDCRHRDLFSCPLADNDFQKDDDYCSWGERREE